MIYCKCQIVKIEEDEKNRLNYGSHILNYVFLNQYYSDVVNSCQNKLLKQSSGFHPKEIFDMCSRLEASETELNRVFQEKTEIETSLIDAKLELTDAKTELNSLKSHESLNRELDEYFYQDHSRHELDS